MKISVRKLILTVFVALGLGVFARPAHAFVFADLIDFGPDGMVVTDNLPAVFMMNINDELAANGHNINEVNITSVNLTVTYANTDGTGFFEENWFLLGLGALEDAGDQPVTTTFTPNAVLMALLQANGLMPVIPFETTFNLPEWFGIPDAFTLYSLSLTGVYELTNTAIPEPATMFLLLPGFLSVLLRRSQI